MRISQMDLKSFGMHHNRSIHLSDGISLIIGENEAGKSTIKAAIECLIYGFGKRYGKYVYRPWNGSPISVSAQGYLKSGESLHISRELKKIPEGHFSLGHQTTEIGNEALFFSSHLNEQLYGQLYSLSTENSTLFQTLDFELVERRLLTTLGASELRPTEAVLEQLKEAGDQLYRFNGRGNSEIKSLRMEINALNETIHHARDQRQKYGEKIGLVHELEEKIESINQEIMHLHIQESMIADCITIEGKLPFEVQGDLEQHKESIESFKRDCTVMIEALNQYKYIKNRMDEKGERCHACEIQLGFSQKEMTSEKMDETIQCAMGAIQSYETYIANKPSQYVSHYLLMVLGVFGGLGAYMVFNRGMGSMASAIGLLSGMTLVMGMVLFFQQHQSNKRLNHAKDNLNACLKHVALNGTLSLEALNDLKGLMGEWRVIRSEKIALESQLESHETAIQRLLLAIEQIPQHDRENIMKRPIEFWMAQFNDFLTDATRQLYVLNDQKTLHLEWLELKSAFESKHQMTYDVACALIENTGVGNHRMARLRYAHDACMTHLEHKEIEKQQGAIELATLKKEIELAALSDLAELDEKKSALEKQLVSQMMERDRLTILYGFIKSQDLLFREQKQPEVMKLAGTYLNTITHGKWHHIGLDNNQELVIRGLNGIEPVKRITSTGMREQLYLALKLALMDSIEEEREPLPLILDEPFSNWDHFRRESLVKLIDTLANKRQIIILSCHNETQALFEELSKYKEERKYKVINLS